MAPSKDWMNITDRFSEPYKSGVETFLNYAFEKLGTDVIRCPCVKCVNGSFETRDAVKGHLIAYGIVRRYTFWYHHGEKHGDGSSDDDDDTDEVDGFDEDDVVEEPVNEMHAMLRDLYPDNDIQFQMDDKAEEEPDNEANVFYKLLKDSEHPLCDGCKVSKMSTLVKLLHIKTIGRWSNESFTMLLGFLKNELLPAQSNLPDSYYEAKKVMKDLGLSYEKIDACTNHCMLYWKEDEFSDACKICGATRWKFQKSNGKDKCVTMAKKRLRKTLRYFSLKPRLQRLYMCSKTATLMRWHHDERKNDGIVRHPADSIVWKSFDESHVDFASDPRNVRLGLASDGFQPFTYSKQPYNIWPVILIPYNLPPEICMRQPNLILSMLIPGSGSPGNSIDIYLQPLIEELKELWDNGVQTFDAVKRHHFQLCAALLWTINDFPAYAMLSGWSTKGKFACPCCMIDTHSTRLIHSGKECYMGHCRYLPTNHPWRKQKDNFDGTVERRLPPRHFSTDDILHRVQDLENIVLSKDPDVCKKNHISHADRGDNWNKKSIFFCLPCWKNILLRHNLDVMHIEKNVCDSILGTIMCIKGKTKDTVNARMDLEHMNLRPTLHPIKEGDKVKIPPAPYTLSVAEKHTFCHFLKELKVPDGFSSNISYCVNVKETQIAGLKSHDCHVILQHLLPLAIRGLLTPLVREALTELSMFFTILCAKVVKKDELQQIKDQIPLTLCKLEKVFPPFFDTMVHLRVHLAEEALLGGPVQFRWMYPIEQQMYKFKSYIRNRAHAEASIAEGYLADECMTLCSRYLQTMETKFNRLNRNHEGENSHGKDLSIFCHPGWGLGARAIQHYGEQVLFQAHIYILKNCDEVQPFIEKYSTTEAASKHLSSDIEWCENFIAWFKDEVADLYQHDKSERVRDLLALSRGPTQHSGSYNGYVVNGFRFHTERREQTVKTQNSGVVVLGNTGDDAENIDYYGVLTEIIELQYLGGNRVVLFRCRWFDVYDSVRGVKTDEYGVVSVNCKRQLKTDDPFVLASQARQVFYAIDNVNKGWHIVLKAQPRSSYEMVNEDSCSSDNDDDGEAYQHGELFKPTYSASTSTGASDEICESRREVEAILVNVASGSRKKGSRKRRRQN